MKKKSIKSLVNWVRATFLVVSIMAMLTVVIWIFAPNVVDKVDTLFVGTYQSYYKRHFKKAKKILKKDKAKGITALESFMKEVAEIKVSDRLDNLKYQAYPLLIKNLKELELFEKALYWTDKWLEFDEKDLFAHAQRVELLYQFPEKKETAKQNIFELYSKFPEAKVVVDAYAQILIQEGEGVEASRVVQSFLDDRPSLILGLWELFWDTGKWFNENQKRQLEPILKEGGELTLSFDLKPGTKNIRIDPPPFSTLHISCLQVKIHCEGRELKFRLAATPLTLYQMTQVGEVLQTTGGNDPSFIWALPEELINSAMSITLSAKVREFSPFLDSFKPQMVMPETTSPENVRGVVR